MEAFQREHIYSHLDELICNTKLGFIFIAYLVSKNILSGSDVAELDSIKNQLDKSRKFYEIIHIEGFGPSSSTYEPDLPEISGRIRKRVRYDVRSPVQLFTGREEELLILCEQLQSNTPQMTLVTQITSITGLGGIGKSELCRKYLQMYSGNHDGNCIWIDAEKPENMKNGFKILAKDHLKISLKDVDGEDKSIETVVDEIKRGIFVFDNAISSDCKHLDKFLPLRVFDAAPRIIITSRDKEWDLPVRVLPLKELKEWDAVEFVKKSLCIENNSQDKMILRLVNCELAYERNRLQQLCTHHFYNMENNNGNNICRQRRRDARHDHESLHEEFSELAKDMKRQIVPNV
ncbi:hypothetical protein Ocin01_16846 [Orchesella cincta]|uniref:NB-ARC domain-containing protein n=1 Tax=Orchesella cincta TaxID=48709 RepID=A0A1D2MA27_ORCCI|nr:hypothetical protein Ocin01_16846 [Orchesella cincta]